MKPGDKIAELLEARGWSQHDLADGMGRPVQAINQIISGKKAITFQTARELEAAFSTPSAMEWLEMEMRYRFEEDRTGDGDALVIKQRIKLQEIAPIRDMIRRGWIEGSKDHQSQEAEVCRFFGQSSLEKIEYPKFNARSSIDLTASHGAWAQQALRLAEGLKPKKYSKKKLSDSVKQIRNMLAAPERVAELPRLLCECGVRLVFVEHLPRTRIDGAAFWIPPGVKKSPVVVMSLRFGRIDYFAFTLLHEIAHILNGDEPSFDTEMHGSADDLPEHEIRANRWAAQTMVPGTELKNFLVSTNSVPGRAAIERFALRQGVHPGVVLGQLQHRAIVPYSSHRTLLVDVRDHLLSRRGEIERAGYAAFDGFKSSEKENSD